jgi:hypothetical protein
MDRKTLDKLTDKMSAKWDAYDLDRMNLPEYEELENYYKEFQKVLDLANNDDDIIDNSQEFKDLQEAKERLEIAAHNTPEYKAFKEELKININASKEFWSEQDLQKKEE